MLIVAGIALGFFTGSGNVIRSRLICLIFVGVSDKNVIP